MIALALVAIVAGAGGLLPAPTPASRCTTVRLGPVEPVGHELRPAAAASSSPSAAGASALRIVGPDAASLATPSDVVAVGEGGMMGIAVDPAFATNRRIYTCFVSNAGGGGRRAGRAVAGERGHHRPHRPHRHPHRHARQPERPALGLPASASGPTATCGWAPATPPMGTNPQNPALARRQGAAHHDRRAPARPATPARRSAARSTPTGTATCRASPSPPTARRTRSSTAPTATTRSTGSCVGGNYGWDPVPGYNETVPMTDRTKFPTRGAARSGARARPTIAPSGGAILSGPMWQGWDKALAMAVLKGQQLRVLGLHPRRPGRRVAVDRRDRPGPAAGRPCRRPTAASTSPPTRANGSGAILAHHAGA